MILGHISLSLTKCHRSESDSRVKIPKQSKMGSTVNYVLPTEHICFRMVCVSIATWNLCQVATSCITTRLNNDMTSSPPLVHSPTLSTTIRQSGRNYTYCTRYQRAYRILQDFLYSSKVLFIISIRSLR